MSGIPPGSIKANNPAAYSKEYNLEMKAYPINYIEV